MSHFKIMTFNRYHDSKLQQLTFIRRIFFKKHNKLKNLTKYHNLKTIGEITHFIFFTFQNYDIYGCHDSELRHVLNIVILKYDNL
jgi:hypothetical protein